MLALKREYGSYGHQFYRGLRNEKSDAKKVSCRSGEPSVSGICRMLGIGYSAALGVVSDLREYLVEE